jgi:hypothetical protein
VLRERVVSFDELCHADLRVGWTYEGGSQGNAGDDPISKLMGCGNQGGFRIRGSVVEGSVRFCILYSSLQEPDWPDSLDISAGQFTYYGDNRTPGKRLHETVGNRLLAEVFGNLHLRRRSEIPPFFVFTKGERGRDVVFRGLAAPGESGSEQSENDLIAVWRTKGQERFLNYKATFSLLNVATVSHKWVTGLNEGEPRMCQPSAWSNWLQGSATAD